MKPFLIPMILASIIAIMVFPVHERVKKFCPKKGKLAATITTVIVFVVFVLPTTIITTILVNQIYQYIGTLDLKDTFGNLFSTDWYTQYILPWVTEFEQRFDIKINLLGVMTQVGKKTASYIYNYSPAALMHTASFIFDFFIMMVGIFFLLIEGPALIRVLFDLSPLRETHERRLSKKLKNTIDASIYGYLVTGVIQGIIAGIIYAIVGLQGFVILGVMTFFMSMVPVVGAAGVWVPVCVWLFLQGQTTEGFIMLAGGIVISLIDNFIKPIVIEGKSNIHPLLIFFSLFGGIQLFGPLGILFGPVITALLIAMINIYREEITTS